MNEEYEIIPHLTAYVPKQACLNMDYPEYTGSPLCDECLRNLNGKLTDANQEFKKYKLDLIFNDCDGFMPKVCKGA